MPRRWCQQRIILKDRQTDPFVSNEAVLQHHGEFVFGAETIIDGHENTWCVLGNIPAPCVLGIEVPDEIPAPVIVDA